jgi:signal transduction histidine kinase
MPDKIVTDCKHLRQVLINVIGNALKYTDQGRVTVTVGQADPGHLNFVVTDTGRGVSLRIGHSLLS